MREGIVARRFLARAAVWGGMISSLGFGIYATVAFDPEHGRFAPQWLSLIFIYLGLVGVIGGVSASRMKLGDTLADIGTAAFKAGVEAGRAQGYKAGFEAGHYASAVEKAPAEEVKTPENS